MMRDNKDLKENHSQFIIECVIQRIRILSSGSCTHLSPTELVQQGYTDPVRLFVKGEPHSKTKLKSKRWRLIMAISAVDQLVERLLCDKQNKTEISQWENIPSAPGISLSDDQGLQDLFDRIKAQPGTIAEADVKGWDWSVKDWELELEGQCRADLCDATPWLRQIFLNREHCVANAIYGLPDGTMVDKLVPGVQCSGRYTTSSGNSRIRVIVAYLVGAEWAFAMGDDCLEDFLGSVELAHERYEALGHPLKMYSETKDSFEFCSMLIQDGLAHPVDGTKTLYNLLEQKDITVELLAQFEMEMRNHPRYSEFMESVGRVVEGRRAKLN
jgi:hypothetical protein